MALNLYRRHRRECKAGHPHQHLSSEFEERKRGWKRCECPIVVSGTLHKTFRRESTGKWEWDDARVVAAGIEAAGSCGGQIAPKPEPLPAVAPHRCTITVATKTFLDELQRTAAFATYKKYGLLMARFVKFSEERGYVMIDQWEPIDVRQTWNSNFNGSSGGVFGVIGANTELPDSGSGTGGVTITSINGVQLPPVVPSSQVATTASGLAYSRVSQTFNGTVTLTNISGSEINGPLQILFTGMPTGVTLVNATNNLSGTPYLTVSAVATLSPSQSVTVSLQFKNPSNMTINFTPVIYSGSIN